MDTRDAGGDHPGPGPGGQGPRRAEEQRPRPPQPQPRPVDASAPAGGPVDARRRLGSLQVLWTPPCHRRPELDRGQGWRGSWWRFDATCTRTPSSPAPRRGRRRSSPATTLSGCTRCQGPAWSPRARDAAYRVALRADLDALPVLDRAGLLGLGPRTRDLSRLQARRPHERAARRRARVECARGRVARPRDRGGAADLPPRGGHPRWRARGRRPRPRRRRPYLRHPLRPGRRRGARGPGDHHRRRRLGHRRGVAASRPA